MPIIQNVTVKGSSLAEARDKALRKLDVREDQVIIEVIDEGSKGFLGFFSKPVVIKAQMKKEVVEELELQNILEDLNIPQEQPQWDKNTSAGEEIMEEVAPELGTPENRMGTAQVKDGQLRITNPSGEGKMALLKPGEHVKLVVNGNEIKEEVLVAEEDELEIIVIDDPPGSELDLRISKDKVEAYLRYLNHPGSKYRLIDQSPNNRLVLKVELADMMELPPPQREEVLEFLEKKRVIKGIIEEAIDEVINNPNCKDHILVAQGQPPVDGINAYIRYPFLEEHEAKSNSIFEHDKLVSVEPGEIIALKQPKAEGKDGWNVEGEVIPAKGALDIEIFIKKGCEIVEEGWKAVASISGRPILETSGQKTYLSVDPIFVVQEVNGATGNIKFAGDVEVKGDVSDGSVVEADGNVEVHGNVSGATISAGACVVVHKMVLGSTVMAGGRTALYSSLLPYLKETKEMLGQMFTRIEERKELGAEQENFDGSMIQALIDGHFGELPKIVMHMSSTVVNNQLPNEDIMKLVDSLYKNLCGLGPLQISNAFYLKELQSSLQEIIEHIDACLKSAEYIKARYVQNSTLVSSGDVMIEGQGCYISSIDAGGKVNICGKPGVARGVRITAGSDIYLFDVGSEFDTQTLVKIKEAGIVTAEQINANVVVQIGREKYRVQEALKSFKAYLNKEGRLEIEKLKNEQVKA